MLTITKPIIVEGKYDKIKVASVARALILTTDGFGIFSSDEKAALFRRLAEKEGVIVLTDSDGAGLVIRNYLKSILPPDKITHLYIPQIKGREKRKREPSKEGLLGVEGIDADWLRTALAPFAAESEGLTRTEMTLQKADLYELGLSGGTGSADRRRMLCQMLSLPDHLSANALLAALNMLVSKEQFEHALWSVKESDRSHS